MDTPQTLDGSPVGAALWKRYVTDGVINHAAWLRTRAEHAPVGNCRPCGSMLYLEAPTTTVDAPTTPPSASAPTAATNSSHPAGSFASTRRPSCGPNSHVNGSALSSWRGGSGGHSPTGRVRIDGRVALDLDDLERITDALKRVSDLLPPV